MNDRERWVRTMHFQSVDHVPDEEFGYWRDTFPVWHAQGMPKWVSNNRLGDAYFGFAKRVVAELAVTLVCNDYGSEVIGDAIEPYFQEAVAREGYRPLPPQERPVVMNVKGASASGKSTMRPLQRILAKKLNLPWEDFALISPDIWRKFLLDYGSPPTNTPAP